MFSEAKTLFTEIPETSQNKVTIHWPVKLYLKTMSSYCRIIAMSKLALYR